MQSLIRRAQVVITVLLLSKAAYAGPREQAIEVHQAFEQYYTSSVSHRFTSLDVNLIRWFVGGCGVGFSIRCSISGTVLKRLSIRGSTAAKLLLSAQLLETGVASDKSTVVDLLKEVVSEHEGASWCLLRLKPVLLSLQKISSKPSRPKLPEKARLLEDRTQEVVTAPRIDPRLNTFTVGRTTNSADDVLSETELHSERESEIPVEPTEISEGKRRLLIIINQ